MEVSNLINNVVMRLKIAYPSYFSRLSNEELIALVQIYKEELNGYNDKVLNSAVRQLIRTSKYMPTLNEIINECEKNKSHNANEIIERMIADGYFKSPQEIDKAYKFIQENNIPSWLKEDMKKYIPAQLTNNTKMIGV